jgi:rifampicin phosphotransferase
VYRWIRPLSQVGLDDLPLAGGKGANLGHLTSAGFPVPPGFCITTAAYEEVVRANDLDRLLAGALPRLKPDRMESYIEAAGVLAAAFAQMPQPLWDEIRHAYADLGGPVAVRSSATAEDLLGASFAGQQETLLNVEGEADLHGAVLRCFASLWSGRAIHYRERMGYPHQSGRLSVIVQQMVPARVAGVMFTAHPITSDQNLCVIEAAPGLGEAVVSGTADVDNFTVEKRSGRLLEAWLVHADQPVLTAGELAELTGFGRRIESLYGRPQDIEWAFDGSECRILQARPITTLR